MRALGLFGAIVGAVSMGMLTTGSVAVAQPETIFEVQKLLASDGESDDWFGAAIDVHEDTVIISATRADAAYIYLRRPSGEWVEDSILSPSDGSGIGEAVALDKGTALISGTSCSGEPETCAGAAYVFIRSASGDWIEHGKLIPSGALPEIPWVSAVDIYGDTAVVTATHEYDEFGLATCAAYVFTRDEAGGWTEQAKLRPSDGVPDDFFGCFYSTLYLEGDTIVVGAPFDPFSFTWRPGAAYVFTRDGTGTWAQTAKLVGSDTEPDEFFGAAVRLSGDTLFVGAPGDDVIDRFGAVYVFIRDGLGEWTESAKLLPHDSQSNDWFGAPIAFDGDVAIVNFGYMGHSREYQFVDLFSRDGNGVWNPQARLMPSDLESYGRDRVGWGLAIADGAAIVGATYADDQEEDSGAAYVFDISPLTDPMAVSIDIKPFRPLNLVDPNSGRGIWVAALSDGDFDPLQIIKLSVRFGPNEASVHSQRVSDVNRDGLGDLVLRFQIPDTGIRCGDTMATLTGETFDGQKFVGTDLIRTVGCP